MIDVESLVKRAEDLGASDVRITVIKSKRKSVSSVGEKIYQSNVVTSYNIGIFVSVGKRIGGTSATVNELVKDNKIVGILDFERTTLQDVTLNITINYEYEEQFINYADVVNSVKFTMIEKKFLLIEDALDELSKTLQKEFSRINTLYLKITKPSILPDCKVSVSNSYNF